MLRALLLAGAHSCIDQLPRRLAAAAPIRRQRDRLGQQLAAPRKLRQPGTAERPVIEEYGRSERPEADERDEPRRERFMFHGLRLKALTAITIAAASAPRPSAHHWPAYDRWRSGPRP